MRIESKSSARDIEAAGAIAGLAGSMAMEAAFASLSETDLRVDRPVAVAGSPRPADEESSLGCAEPLQAEAALIAAQLADQLKQLEHQRRRLETLLGRL